MPKQHSIPLWWSHFITEYLKNGQNAKRAYLKVRPNVTERTAEVNAEKLLRNTDFVNLLKASTEKIEAKIAMTQERWAQLLADVCEVNLGEFLKTEEGSGDTQLVSDWKDKPKLHAIDSINLNTTTLESGAVVQRVSISKANKIEALKTLGKALGYLTEKVEHSGSVTYEIADPYAKPTNKDHPSV